MKQLILKFALLFSLFFINNNLQSAAIATQNLPTYSLNELEKLNYDILNYQAILTTQQLSQKTSSLNLTLEQLKLLGYLPHFSVIINPNAMLISLKHSNDIENSLNYIFIIKSDDKSKSISKYYGLFRKDKTAMELSSQEAELIFQQHLHYLNDEKNKIEFGILNHKYIIEQLSSESLTTSQIIKVLQFIELEILTQGPLKIEFYEKLLNGEIKLIEEIYQKTQ